MPELHMAFVYLKLMMVPQAHLQFSFVTLKLKKDEKNGLQKTKIEQMIYSWRLLLSITSVIVNISGIRRYRELHPGLFLQEANPSSSSSHSLVVVPVNLWLL